MWYKIAKKSPNMLLFLDIDGVLNKYPKYDDSEIKKDISKLTNYIDSDCVARLNEIVDLFNPTIILSSYWRRAGKLEDIQKILESKGFKGKLSDKTPEVGKEHKERYEQIEKVLKEYKPDIYIILDDSILDENPEFEDPNWIRTDRKTGLSHNDVDKIIKIIKGKEHKDLKQ
jgi:uncharacterized protein YihD (DUF1040 family)